MQWQVQDQCGVVIVEVFVDVDVFVVGVDYVLVDCQVQVGVLVIVVVMGSGVEYVEDFFLFGFGNFWFFVVYCEMQFGGILVDFDV